LALLLNLRLSSSFLLRARLTGLLLHLLALFYLLLLRGRLLLGLTLRLSLGAFLFALCLCSRRALLLFLLHLLMQLLTTTGGLLRGGLRLRALWLSRLWLVDALRANSAVFSALFALHLPQFLTRRLIALFGARRKICHLLLPCLLHGRGFVERRRRRSIRSTHVSDLPALCDLQLVLALLIGHRFDLKRLADVGLHRQGARRNARHHLAIDNLAAQLARQFDAPVCIAASSDFAHAIDRKGIKHRMRLREHSRIHTND
jgi:hypothetical protein